MTATLTLNTSTTIWTSEYGSNSFDIGTIKSERPKVDNGTDMIPLTGKSSDEAQGFNTRGQSLKATVQGTYTGTISEIKEFTKKLKIASNDQVESLINGTIDYYMTYENTNSKIYPLYNGVKILLSDYNINDTSKNSVSAVNYTLSIVQTKGEL